MKFFKSHKVLLVILVTLIIIVISTLAITNQSRGFNAYAPARTSAAALAKEAQAADTQSIVDNLNGQVVYAEPATDSCIGPDTDRAGNTCSVFSGVYIATKKADAGAVIDAQLTSKGYGASKLPNSGLTTYNKPAANISKPMTDNRDIEVNPFIAQYAYNNPAFFKEPIVSEGAQKAIKKLLASDPSATVISLKLATLYYKDF